MKNILKIIIIVYNRIILYFNGFKNYINRIKEYTYSSRYCIIFKTSNVFFKYPVNYVKGCQYFSIGKGTRFGTKAVLTAWDNYEGYTYTPIIKIGEKCNFGDYLHITSINEIIIGNNVLTGRWVTITDNAHGTSNEICNGQPPEHRKLFSKGPVFIGNNVWIGDKVTILPGVSIGENSIIAANSVVTHDIPKCCVAGGNPAIILKRYD